MCGVAGVYGGWREGERKLWVNMDGNLIGLNGGDWGNFGEGVRMF